MHLSFMHKSLMWYYDLFQVTGSLFDFETLDTISEHTVASGITVHLSALSIHTCKLYYE